MADGILAVESTKSLSPTPIAQTPAPIDKRGFHGVALPWFVLSEILERLDQASEVARRIDARQRKLGGDHATHYRSPVLRLAGLIKGIYSTLDREWGNAKCVDDVRCHKPPFSGATVGVYGESDLPGDNAIALRMYDFSMTDPAGPVTFPLNAIIIVDQDRTAKPGDFVVVREFGVKDAFFRRLDFDGERYSLHALNPLYSSRPLLDNAKIVGVATHVQTPIVNTRKNTQPVALKQEVAHG
jgi:Peptidase S24-like